MLAFIAQHRDKITGVTHDPKELRNNRTTSLHELGFNTKEKCNALVMNLAFSWDVDGTFDNFSIDPMEPLAKLLEAGLESCDLITPIDPKNPVYRDTHDENGDLGCVLRVPYSEGYVITGTDTLYGMCTSQDIDAAQVTPDRFTIHPYDHSLQVSFIMCFDTAGRCDGKQMIIHHLPENSDHAVAVNYKRGHRDGIWQRYDTLDPDTDLAHGFYDYGRPVWDWNYYNEDKSLHAQRTFAQNAQNILTLHYADKKLCRIDVIHDQTYDITLNRRVNHALQHHYRLDRLHRLTRGLLGQPLYADITPQTTPRMINQALLDKVKEETPEAEWPCYFNDKPHYRHDKQPSPRQSI